MAKGSGSGGILRTKDYRSGRAFIIPQNDGTTQKLRFNQSANRYEYLDTGRFAMNQWKPLSNISYAFISEEYVEAQLRTVRRKIRFA